MVEEIRDIDPINTPLDGSKISVPKRKNRFLAKKITWVILIFSVSVFGGLLGSFVYNYVGSGQKSFSETFKRDQTLKVEEESATIDVVKKISPSVVSITQEGENLDFFGQLFKTTGSGTGFIVESNGLILTNKHVVSDKNAKYSVFMVDGTEYEAKILAIDPSYDLAFLKIEASDLPVVELGDSDSLQVGQKVIAIGNTLGQYQNTVTSGVISGIGRLITAGGGEGLDQETLENVIQTDAAINPGNSGGPLVNLAGQVVSVNTAVDQGGQLIGFSIPINLVKSALQSVIETGKVIRPMIGVRYINITKEFALRNSIKKEKGALVYSGSGEPAVILGSPAQKAGLKESDIIVKINGSEILPTKSLALLLQQYQVGDKLKLTIFRDEVEFEVEVVLAELK